MGSCDFVSILVGGCRCAVSCYDLGVTFDLGSARMVSTVSFETNFSYYRDIWITATDYYMHCYLIELSPFLQIFQFINK